MKVIVSEAHDSDMRVAAHAHSTEGIRHVLAAGVDTVKHGSFIDEACIDIMLKQGTWLVPTLSISDFTIARGEKSGARPEGIAKIKIARGVRRNNIRKAMEAGCSVE